MIKNKLLSLLFLGVVILSCSDDDESPNTNPIGEIPCTLTELNYGSDAKETYEWNGNQLTKIAFIEDGEEEGYVQIQYANGKVSKVEEYEEGELEGTKSYEYGSNGQWSRIVETYAGDDNSGTVYTATYDANGLRTKIVFEYNYDGIEETEVEEYTYADGNLVKTEATWTSSSGSHTTISTYEYSDEENKLGPLQEFLNMIYHGDASPSKNYETKQIQTSNGVQSGSSTTEYTFNDEGLPTQMIQTWTWPGSQTDIETANFVWDCK